MSESAKSVRQKIREGEWNKPTSGLAPGYTQDNLVILHKSYAFDFLLFAQRTPKSCPILEVTDVGSPVPKKTAPTADLRTDVPKYKIFKNGEFVEEVNDITQYWSDDLVSFLIGCSFTFERALIENQIPIRHIDEKTNAAMYITNIETEPAGIFKGPMVVSMRPMMPSDAIRAVQVTTNLPQAHGAPIHIGDPAQIGIKDLQQPDFGDVVPIKDGEVPVFWACGVTSQLAIEQAKPNIAITHSPGHMFITDIREEQLAII